MFSKQTADNLHKLAQSVIVNKGERSLGPSFSTKWGEIPDDIEFDRTGGDSLSISGDEYRQYVICLESLINERELEYLSKREVDKELWHLVCEIFIGSDTLREPRAFRLLLSSFQDRLKKPLEEYEIIVPIENLQFGGHVHKILGVEFFEPSPEFLKKWGIDKDNKIHKFFYDAVISKGAAVLSEYAADPSKAVERARDTVNTALDMLRIALLFDHEPRIIGWKIHDEEMLFRRSEHAAARKVGDYSFVFFSGQRAFRSIELKINDVISKQIEASQKIIDCLFNKDGMKGRIRERILRAATWISNSIIREEPDDKIVDVCTALETLLTTKGDLRKGECIALRTTLINTKLNKPFFDPVHVMNLYLKRSDIVHGSSRRICTESDYQIGRLIALDVVSKSLEYIKSNNITQHKSFIDSLQDDKVMFQKAVDFWKPYTKYYPDILKAAERIVGNKKPDC